STVSRKRISRARSGTFRGGHAHAAREEVGTGAPPLAGAVADDLPAQADHLLDQFFLSATDLLVLRIVIDRLPPARLALAQQAFLPQVLDQVAVCLEQAQHVV